MTLIFSAEDEFCLSEVRTNSSLLEHSQPLDSQKNSAAVKESVFLMLRTQRKVDRVCCEVTSHHLAVIESG